MTRNDCWNLFPFFPFSVCRTAVWAFRLGFLLDFLVFFRYLGRLALVRLLSMMCLMVHYYCLSVTNVIQYWALAPGFYYFPFLMMMMIFGLLHFSFFLRKTGQQMCVLCFKCVSIICFEMVWQTICSLSNIKTDWLMLLPLTDSAFQFDLQSLESTSFSTAVSAFFVMLPKHWTHWGMIIMLVSPTHTQLHTLF